MYRQEDGEDAAPAVGRWPKRNKMISRKSAMAISNFYSSRFTIRKNSNSSSTISQHSLYDFLFENDYPAHISNAARGNLWPRDLKDWVLKLHTGETLINATKTWSWQEREKLGQRYLKDLAESILNWYAENRDKWNQDSYDPLRDELLRRLELDGYVYRDAALFYTGGDVLNVEEERTLLHHLHTSLGLPNQVDTFQFLQLSEEHFMAGRWSDCIGNSRKFFEAILGQIAATYSQRILGTALGPSVLSRPVDVRRFLEDKGLVETKEREAIDKVYGLLSYTGGHPYMAEDDQARLLRQLSLVLTQFALLRFEGALK
jgi:hypothetical protein